MLPLHKRTLVNVSKTINFYDLEHFGSKKTIVFYKIYLRVIEKKLRVKKIELKNMTYLVWESNPRLSVHETDTPPTELMRFLHLPSWVQTDDLQNYSLMLFQLSFWQNR